MPSYYRIFLIILLMLNIFCAYLGHEFNLWVAMLMAFTIGITEPSMRLW